MTRRPSSARQRLITILANLDEGEWMNCSREGSLYRRELHQLEREGLVSVSVGGNHYRLTPEGERLARSVGVGKPSTLH